MKAILVLLTSAIALLVALPAEAHHPLGGAMPQSVWDGLLSGLAHPVIGLDHLAFIIAAGLLAALKRQGIWIPVMFVLASLAGTGIHLLGVDLPAPELFISASVLLFGILLATEKPLGLLPITGLGAIAGLFHGYAYGEAIVGAEMTALLAYLIGFTAIQLAIALLAYGVAKRMSRYASNSVALSLRYVGFTICGIGAAFLRLALG